MTSFLIDVLLTYLNLEVDYYSSFYLLDNCLKSLLLTLKFTFTGVYSFTLDLFTGE